MGFSASKRKGGNRSEKIRVVAKRGRSARRTANDKKRNRTGAITVSIDVGGFGRLQLAARF